MFKKGEWTKEEEIFLLKNNEYLSTREISEKLNRDEQSIRYKRMKLGLKKQRNKPINPYQKQWNNEDIEFLKNNYNNFSIKELSEKLNRTKPSIQCKAKKMGLKKEDKYFYDKDFFKYIDSEEKAYWLGFVYADGYIIDNSDNKNYEFGICLSIKDIEHLKKFNKSINGNINIATKEKYTFGKTHTMCSIRLYCKEMIKDLESHNIFQNKTYLECFPIVDKNLMPHFLRGYFDGDGCIVIDKKRKRHNFDYCSVNLKFLEYIRTFIYEEYEINSYIIKEKMNDIRTVDCYRLKICGLKNDYNFGQLLYKNANIYLDRKYEKYTNAITMYNITSRIKNK